MTKSNPSLAEVVERGWEPLLRTAENYGLSPQTRWSVLEVDFPATFDMGELETLCTEYSYQAIVQFGDDRVELDVTADSLADAQVNEVAALAATESEARNIRDTGSGWQIAAQLSHMVERTRVSYNRANWCISADRLAELIADDWLSVAQRLVQGSVVIGEEKLHLEPAAELAAKVLVPSSDDPGDTEADSEAAIQLMLLADATAWREIAISEDRRDGDLWLALCQDQPADIKVVLGDVTGGVELWKWLGDGSDVNRNEALRHVLRSQTAVARGLPRARAVRTLAERHRLALARDNAAEVYRAVEESQRRTADAIDNAKQRMSQYFEETIKISQGTIAAAVALAALIARAGSILPNWLLGFIAFAAVSGLCVLGHSRCRNARQLEHDLTKFGASLASDCLLPDDERRKLADTIMSFDAVAERKRVERVVRYLGTLAAVVVVATVAWLTTVEDTSVKPQPLETNQPERAP